MRRYSLHTFIKRMVLAATCLPVFALAQHPAEVFYKQRSTYYTDQKVRNATENIARYDWARIQKQHIVERADRWMHDFGGDLDALWRMMPSQQVPRSYAVNSFNGCLVCGKAINRFGNYSYLYDKTKTDWKLTCPNCHLTFPTNDFKSYYEGGLDKDGKFNPDMALRHNKQLIKKGGKGNLINLYSLHGLSAHQLKDLKAAGVSDSTIHRITTDPTWGVDNGWGYHFNPKDKARYGDPYAYVAYYSHWVIWYWRVMPMLEDISKAYMFTRYSTDPVEQTKSKQYADAAIVMLDRVADLYPEMFVEPFPHNDHFGLPNSGYHWGTMLSAGRVVGSIWENTFIKAIMLAYDAVYPGIDALSDNARRVLDKMSGSASKGDATSIKANLEKGILREVYKAYVDGDLQGNPGMHQSTLAMAAVLMDHNPETQQWLNMVFRNGRCDWHDVGKRDAGNVMNYLVDRISRDGQGDEVSMGYNSGWLPNWSVIAKVLDGYRIPDGQSLAGGINPDINQNPRFETLYDANYPYLLTDDYLPNIGDTGFTGEPSHSLISLEDLILGYQLYHKPEQAQAIYFLTGRNVKKVHANIFAKNPEQIQDDIQRVIAEKGELHLSSANFSAYGLSMLRDGLSPHQNNGQGTQRTLWMFYGNRNASHNHADPLNLGYMAYRLDLMPDFGYPNTLGGDANPEQLWDKSTPAHNTVSFDDLGYRGHIVGYGRPLHFAVSPDVQVMQASADSVENSNIFFAKKYDRTSALVRIDDANSYIVDFFHVNSDRPYRYNFHTAEIDSAATQLKNIDFIDENPVTYYDVTLRKVRTALTKGRSFTVDWNVLDTWNCYAKGFKAKTDVHLCFTMLGGSQHICMGEAVPPTNVDRNPSWVPLLQVQAQGEHTFTAVMDAYQDNRLVMSVDSVPVTLGRKPITDDRVKAVKVSLVNGRTDYIVYARDKAMYKVGNLFYFSGFFGVYSIDKNGKLVRTYINDGTQIGKEKTIDRLTGTVVDATDKLCDDNYLRVKMNVDTDPMTLVGKYIYVNNDDVKEMSELLKYNAVYPIRHAVKEEDGTYRLDLGDCSVIRGWKDINDYGKGYLRDFNLGASFYIPF